MTPTLTFYLGLHHPNWLTTIAVPAFVSHRRLSGRRTLPRAAAPWVVDSGGYSELSLHGQWTTTPGDYARAVRRYQQEIGRLEVACIQDWMTETHILGRTNLTQSAHQRRTVASYLQLRSLAPDLPWAPTLQGREPTDYERCADLYEAHGITLAAQPVVAVGSLCRRRSAADIHAILTRLRARGLTRLHGFGVKTTGLTRCAGHLRSADSMAWSYAGRFHPGCTPSHRTESNCLHYALAWRQRLLARLGRSAASIDTPVGGAR